MFWVSDQAVIDVSLDRNTGRVTEIHWSGLEAAGASAPEEFGTRLRRIFGLRPSEVIELQREEVPNDFALRFRTEGGAIGGRKSSLNSGE
jgi:hypothetical protein